MSLHVLLLVLTAAVFHASWNLLAKKTKGKTPFIWLQYIASIIIYLPFIIYQKHSWPTDDFHPLLWFSLSSAVLHLGYFIVLQKGYRSADLSVVYPLARGSAPFLSFISAIVFLDEQLKVNAAIGLFLIIAGVLVITGLSFKKENNATIM
jgi:drug/metabolite transporter (DMT)-like permease